MKKLTLFLAAALLAASFAACGNSGASSSTAPEPTAIPDDILNAPATKPDPDMEIDPGFGVDPEDSSAALQPEPDAELSGIVDQIYAAHPVDLMMVETTAVDLTNAEWYPYQTGLNEDVINKVNDFFKPVKQKYVDSGRINPKSMATDAQALVYKVPGGMLSNMIANLTDMKAMDKFDAALAEIPAVRKDLGYPPLVTPLSQMVGNQAVTNVLLGERYKQVSKEVKNYFKGEYGIAPAPVSEELQTKILGEGGLAFTACTDDIEGGKPVDCRIEDSKRTGEEFKAAKEALGDLARSEEDVMSYICYPDQAMKFFEARKAKEENICKYSIVEA